MVKANSSLALRVEVGGGSQVGHVGLWLLGRFADRLQVGEVLSEAFGSSGVVGDRGRLLVHLMLVLAGGGEACTDIETLRSQRGLFGEVASDSTLYRTLTGADEGLVESLAGAMATVRERVWADYPEGETVVLDIDSSVHELHSENKAGAAPTYNRKYGFHPMYCFADWSGEPLAARLRRGDATPNQVSDLADVLDAAIGALPKRMRVGHSPGDDPATVAYPIRVRADSAAGPAFATECRKRNIGFSFVARSSDGIAEALSHIPPDDPRWQPALPQPRPAPHNNPNSGEADKGPDNPEKGPDNSEEGPDAVCSDNNQTEHVEPKPVRAHVIELTDHVKAYRWPDDLRLVVRREPLHPGARTSLFDSERYRYWGHWTDQPEPAPESDRDMRAHARVETHTARVKDQGGNRFPFAKYAPNRLWLHIVALADTPLRWFQKLSQTQTPPPHTRAKPKTLRPNLWHIPGIITRHSRRTTLRIPLTWPTATLIATTHQQIQTL